MDKSTFYTVLYGACTLTLLFVAYGLGTIAGGAACLLK